MEWLLNLPWLEETKDNYKVKEVMEILDETHYGLDDVKYRIASYVAVMKHTNNTSGPIICLIGPPGVGKTTLAKSIAKSLGRKFVKISVGGISDEAEIIGHRRTYLGANPGKIIQGMKKARPDLDVFFDVDSLRSGDDWELALHEEIKRRDVLFLCWSHFARESKWVDAEWRYALEQKGADCIEPVPIESPDICPPPVELSFKHFNDKLLYIIDSVR